MDSVLGLFGFLKDFDLGVTCRSDHMTIRLSLGQPTHLLQRDVDDRLDVIGRAGAGGTPVGSRIAGVHLMGGDVLNAVQEANNEETGAAEGDPREGERVPLALIEKDVGVAVCGVLPSLDFHDGDDPIGSHGEVVDAGERG